MELQSLNNSFENYIEKVPKSFYKKLIKNLERIEFKKRTKILKISDYQTHFYYLSNGIASGSDSNGTVSMFCEENEIIIFDKSLQDVQPSTLNITLEKGSNIYRVERHKLYQLAGHRFINKLLTEILSANTIYCNGLNAQMKTLRLRQRLYIIQKLHKPLFNAKLDLLASFVGASIPQVSKWRKTLL